MNIHFIRHATFYVEAGGVRMLVDPMFADAEARPPIANSSDHRRNPLVSLPEPLDGLPCPDLVLVTHLHRDHWDEAAASWLPETVPIFCQPGDDAAIRSEGFQSVQSVERHETFNGISLTRTSGRHGTGEMGKKMGRVSGFVLKVPEEPILYIAGDTIWCDEVREVLDTFHPDIAIVNAGGARFQTGGAITMDADDVVKLCTHARNTKIVAVHMDSINHCVVTREDLHRRLMEVQLTDRVMIPEDGERIHCDHEPF